MIISPASILAFSDVGDHWAKNEIMWASNEGYFIGDEKGLFNPNNQISRAEFVVAFTRLANLSETTDVKYVDVKNGDWFYDAVSKLSAKGVLKNEGNFYPKKPITREEVSYIIGKLYNKIGNAAELKFNDKDGIDVNYIAYVAALVERDVLHGTPEGNFNPKLSITRAETAKIFYNLVKNMDKFTDGASNPKAEENNTNVAKEAPKKNNSSKKGGEYKPYYPPVINPVKPGKPEKPEEPTNPEKPEEPTEPEKPEEPTEPEKPETEKVSVESIDFIITATLKDNHIGAYKLNASTIKGTDKAVYYSVVLIDKNGKERDSEKTQLFKIGEKFSKPKGDTNIPVTYAEKVTVRLFDSSKKRIAEVKDVKVNKVENSNKKEDDKKEIGAKLILVKENALQKKYKLEFTGDTSKYTSYSIYYNAKSGKKYINKNLSLDKVDGIQISNAVKDTISIDLYDGDKLVHTIENIERIN